MYRCALALLVVVGCGHKTEGDGDGSSGVGSTSGASTSAGATTMEPTNGEGPAVTSSETGSDLGMCPGQNNHLEGDKCFCDDGFMWCDLLNDADLSCCPLEDVTTTMGTSLSGSTTADMTTGEPVACDAPPQGDCDPQDGAVYCQMAPGCEVQGSVIYWCDGTWQVDEVATTMACTEQGEDFAFGCSVEGEAVKIECGHGPGTACAAEDMSFCTDVTTLQTCVYGKLADVDCVQACKDGEIDGMAHASGYCMASRISALCECCDGINCP